jgi:hypothetical protein
VVELLERLFPGSRVRVDDAFDSDGWLFGIDHPAGAKSVKLLSSPSIDRLDSTSFAAQAERRLTEILAQPGRRRAVVTGGPLGFVLVHEEGGVGAWPAR